jgi:K+-transporting ATPase KdpF subunit
VNAANAVGLVLSILVAIFLVVALIKSERF